MCVSVQWVMEHHLIIIIIIDKTDAGLNGLCIRDITLIYDVINTYTHPHTHPFNGPFPGLPRWAGTRKVKQIWILPKQETVSGSGISWAICKSAPRSTQITTPATHHSVFYRPDALPAAQPTASKHWRHKPSGIDIVHGKSDVKRQKIQVGVRTCDSSHGSASW